MNSEILYYVNLWRTLEVEIMVPMNKGESSYLDKPKEKFQAKMGRRQREEWIEVCPQCLSIRVQPRSGVSIVVENQEWECLDCSYVGVLIEVNVADWERIRKERYRTNIKKRRNIPSE